MITTKLVWWLWNQMFQYALGKSLAIKNNTELYLDITSFENYKLHKYCLEIFNIEKNYATKRQIPFYYGLGSSQSKLIGWVLTKCTSALRALNSRHVIERHFNFDAEVLNSGKNTYLEGYWQTEKYFKDTRDAIRQEFTVTIPPSKKNSEMLEKINSCNSVSLHIRRWDYVSNPSANEFHWTCSLDYYGRAMELIWRQVEKPVFFVFSDDIEWAKENLRSEYELVFVDLNNADTNYEDLRLMYSCKHHIIANSSFSWWGAWLWRNPKKIVVAPKRWFQKSDINTQDVVPENWIKI